MCGGSASEHHGLGHGTWDFGRCPVAHDWGRHELVRAFFMLLAFLPFVCFLAASVVSLVHGHPIASSFFALASLLAIPNYHAR